VQRTMSDEILSTAANVDEKSHLEGLQSLHDLESHSFNRPHHRVSAPLGRNLAPSPRYHDFYSVHDCHSPSESGNFDITVESKGRTHFLIL